MSLGVSLPPSAGSFQSINVERMERGYKFITSSIIDLARHQCFRGVNVSNKNIIASIQARCKCEQAYGEPELIQAYYQKFGSTG